MKEPDTNIWPYTLMPMCALALINTHPPPHVSILFLNYLPKFVMSSISETLFSCSRNVWLAEHSDMQD